MGGPWSLDFVKAIKSGLGITVNDVFMAAFAGAIRRYCIEHNDTEFIAEWTGSGCRKKKQSVLCRALVPFAFLR